MSRHSPLRNSILFFFFFLHEINIVVRTSNKSMSVVYLSKREVSYMQKDNLRKMTKFAS